MNQREHLHTPKNESSDKEISKYEIVSDKYFFDKNQKDFHDNKRKSSRDELKANLIKNESSNFEKTESFIAKLNSKNNLIALVYIIIAEFIFSASNVISKILIEDKKSLGFDSINLVMGITMFFINVFLREKEIISELKKQSESNKKNFLDKNISNNYENSKVYFKSSFVSYEKNDNENFINNNTNKSDLQLNNLQKSKQNFLYVFSDLKTELNKDFNSTCIFLVRCLLGTFAEIFLFFSFKDLRINTAITLFTVYPIISSFLSYLYLDTNIIKSRKTLISDFLFLIFCLIFVSFITKPEFFFGAANPAMKKDSFAGFINIGLSVLCNAFAIFFHKKVADKFNNYTFNIFFGINFILFAFFLMLIDKFTVFDLDSTTVFLLFLMSLLFNISQTLFNLCIKLGEIIVVLPMSYLNIVLGFVNNIIFLKGVWDYLDLLGSFGIITINVYRIILTSRE